MTVPANVVSDLSALVVNVTAASPLEGATRILIEALQQEGLDMLDEVDAALAGAAGGLDAGDPAGFAGTLPNALLGLATASEDQSTLSDMRGLIGRAMFNLAQAPGS